jgi:IS30 family transposase
MSESHDVLLTIKEYAALVGKHPDTVRHNIRRGRFRWPVERDSAHAHIRIRVPEKWAAQTRRPLSNDSDRPS